jgi:hypothetical protein
VARLRGRRDDLGKVAIWKHVPSSARPRLAFADRRVEVLGGRDLKSLHPRRQRLLVLCLDDQMDVRALDADVHDTEILAPGCRQRCFADRLVHTAAAQVADGADGAQYHVDRIPLVQAGSLLVR